MVLIDCDTYGLEMKKGFLFFADKNSKEFICKIDNFTKDEELQLVQFLQTVTKTDRYTVKTPWFSIEETGNTYEIRYKDVLLFRGNISIEYLEDDEEVEYI